MSRTQVSISKRKPLEWPATLSDHDLAALGWHPVPFVEFVIKIHSRCNLACNYCYVYDMGDTTWADQPGSMSTSVMQAIAERIHEHARRHDLRNVLIALHGGEPLLVPRRRLAELLETLSAELHPDLFVQLVIQTNGVLLDTNTLAILAEYDVRIGISLDGGQVANDRHRRRRDGSGTHALVVDRLRSMLSGPYSYLFTGFLAVIDLANDPIQAYDDLRSFDPPALDFLLPHANWSQLPPGDDGASETPYGDWLVKLFDHWFDSGREEPSIRLFDSILQLQFGQSTDLEMVGLGSARQVFIETDGTYELLDILKTSYHGAAQTALNAFDHDLDTVLRHPAIAIRQCGAQELCETCRRCEFVDVCGGGYFPHRYRAGDGYLNPSVFCKDLQRLYTHIRSRLTNV